MSASPDLVRMIARAEGTVVHFYDRASRPMSKYYHGVDELGAMLAHAQYITKRDSRAEARRAQKLALRRKGGLPGI